MYLPQTPEVLRLPAGVCQSALFMQVRELNPGFVFVGQANYQLSYIPSPNF